MARLPATNRPVMRSVTHPPPANLNQTVTQRTVPVSRNPTPFIAIPNFHFAAVFRSFHQCRTMPNWEREKVRKTLMEYMMTRYSVSYTHLRAHETRHDLVCRLLLE